ncbi:MAG: tetratricopeptide repeat protein, partial [Kofleriaceae bacterium]|nr:tetratricopeptide repeat protein [Kofleriaceae bacterium]
MSTAATPPRRPGWRIALVVLAVLASAGWEPFRSPDPDVVAGNQAYAQGRFADAIEAYERARARGEVDRAGLDYNIGTSKLRMAEAGGDGGDAVRTEGLAALERATTSTDPQLRAQAHYNRGNALLPSEPAKAIESYKQALREDPDLNDARHNLELALRRMKRDQQKQQQGQQG